MTGRPRAAAGSGSPRKRHGTSKPTRPDALFVSEDADALLPILQVASLHLPIDVWGLGDMEPSAFRCRFSK